MRAKRLFVCATALWLAIAPGSAWASSDYNVSKLMQIVTSTGAKPNAEEITLVCAHRGYWEFVPENTLEAVQAALDRNIEAVELDVRLDQDKTPVLMHDWALDRTTNGTHFVSDTPTDVIKGLKRRDNAGRVTSISVPTLEDALVQLYRYNASKTTDGGDQRGYILVLDVKDKQNASAVSSYDAAVASWDEIQKLQGLINKGRTLPDGKPPTKNINIAEAVFIKVLARELPIDPAVIAARMPAVRAANGPAVGAHLFPILYWQDFATRPSGSANEYMNYSSDDAKVSRWDRYLSAGRIGQSSVISYEVVLPTTDLALSYGYDQKLKASGRFRSGFSPWNDYPEGTSMGTGECCRDRSQSPAAGVTNTNFTGNWEYLASLNVNMITSDRPDIIDDYLYKIGRRNMAFIR